MLCNTARQPLFLTAQPLFLRVNPWFWQVNPCFLRINFCFEKSLLIFDVNSIGQILLNLLRCLCYCCTIASLGFVFWSYVCDVKLYFRLQGEPATAIAAIWWWDIIELVIIFGQMKHVTVTSASGIWRLVQGEHLSLPVARTNWEQWRAVVHRGKGAGHPLLQHLRHCSPPQPLPQNGPVHIAHNFWKAK